MSAAVVFYDDRRARNFEPFASTRPICEMIAGVKSIRERWAEMLQPNRVQFVAGNRHEYFDEGAAVAAQGAIPRGTIIVNSRAVPALASDIGRSARQAAACTMWHCGGQLAAVRLGAPVDARVFADGTLTLDELNAATGSIGELNGWWVEEVWDFVRLLPELLANDIGKIVQRPAVAESIGKMTAPLTAVLGDHPVAIPEPGDGDVHGATRIEPHVILDASAGPILIQPGAHLHAFTRVNGPCYIGRGTNVMGGDISGSSIGDVCKVRGELSSTVLAGYSNKGHDGFIGHSYIGRWVNLGAGTITSNLKNTYGTVSLWTPTGIRDTGMQFLGTLFGDHVKTGIGLRLTTGTVLGAGANVYGNMPPKVVAPFSWGDTVPYSLYESNKFLETAARMMARREVELTDRARRHLAAVHAGRWTVRT
jgi:UDP-N-acetylglucosamine diphosphorylase/glucosamine-1-phosphate N-acetyltransferase